jgi:predicted N-acyltransferase
MKIRIFDSIQQIGERNWKPLENPEFLFTDFKYLSALERSGSLGDRTGWQPHYITCWSDTDLETAVVTYLKNISLISLGPMPINRWASIITPSSWQRFHLHRRPGPRF